jgi:integrase
MRGSVVKRGRTWSYVVDVGRDPVTGRRRQRWRGGYATKSDAERALAGEITGAGVGETIQ